MFAISEIEDKIELAPSLGCFYSDIVKIINKRYIKKHTLDVGIGIKLFKDFEICEQRLVQDFVLATVKFKMLFFRFIRDEILIGKVISQSQVGVFVSLEFFDRILVEQTHLPEENEPTNILNETNEKHFAWVWVYKGNRLVIKNGETVRMKVLHYDKKDGKLRCSFKETGLGPISWWE
ncbi:DNA-directed RNA polymerase III subunit rpc8 [Nosema granulosis]|uniref:DNA-directed RNA polymerase III subunit rpc8 n=1 Tax=Nosema granulosis TaxID=83296 RepID=A0A9P6H355_9MICR|nr:DNA-directed RNA polymerase III subunit rpc8 [Nosema granulosis]